MWKSVEILAKSVEESVEKSVEIHTKSVEIKCGNRRERKCGKMIV